MGLKMVNFMHNLSRRCILIVERRLDQVAPASMRASGPLKRVDNRMSME